MYSKGFETVPDPLGPRLVYTRGRILRCATGTISFVKSARTDLRMEVSLLMYSKGLETPPAPWDPRLAYTRGRLRCRFPGTGTVK